MEATIRSPKQDSLKNRRSMVAFATNSLVLRRVSTKESFEEREREANAMILEKSVAIHCENK